MSVCPLDFREAPARTSRGYISLYPSPKSISAQARSLFLGSPFPRPSLRPRPAPPRFARRSCVCIAVSVVPIGFASGRRVTRVRHTLCALASLPGTLYFAKCITRDYSELTVTNVKNNKLTGKVENFSRFSVLLGRVDCLLILDCFQGFREISLFWKTFLKIFY